MSLNWLLDAGKSEGSVYLRDDKFIFENVEVLWT